VEEPQSAHRYGVTVSDDLSLGRTVRAQRHRQRWRQSDLAEAAGVGRGVIVAIETGCLGRVRVDDLRAVGAALDLRVPLEWRAQRRRLFELGDTGHAALVEAVVRLLMAAGWEARVESLSAAGAIDVLAFEPRRQMLLVVEVKTRVVDIQRTLRDLGLRRAAARVAGLQFGWHAAGVSALLVIGATSAQRRLVASHRSIFRAAFPVQGWDARRWLRAPGAAAALLMFVPSVHGRSTIHTSSVRVRLDRAELAGRAVPSGARERELSCPQCRRPPMSRRAATELGSGAHRSG
jgi:transcriptional regulator with XRE-family HTH domain